MQRGQFSSTLTFVLAAAGSAVGLGNIWGFPTNAAENGGAAFLLMYLILAFLLAYPALMAELIIGRHTRANMVMALDAVSTGNSAKKLGRLTGYAGMITASLILSFYGIVAGWMLGSMAQPVTTILGLDSLGQWLTEFGTARNITLTAIFMLLTGLIINAGVEQGIEKWSRRLMPSLIILLLALIAYVLTREGAIEGLRHYLVPDFSQLTDPDLLVSALGQAFFSMSLGVGTMLIYGSYIRSDANLPLVGSLVTLADTGIAFLAGLLILVLGFFTWRSDLDVAKPLLVSSLRMVIQLFLIGLILVYIFSINHPLLVLLIGLIMLLVAGREVSARQKYSIKGLWSYGIGTCSMFVSSFAVSIFGLLAIIRAENWWDPRYAIPVLGMLLGNTMTAVALSIDRFTANVWNDREMIEARLIIGETSRVAIKDIVRDSLRSGLMPVINSMAIAGIVSLPGMMTGQILAGNSPNDAVRYQIVIWLLIAVGCGFGSMIAVKMVSTKLFDDRERLRIDRISLKKP